MTAVMDTYFSSLAHVLVSKQYLEISQECVEKAKKAGKVNINQKDHIMTVNK